MSIPTIGGAANISWAQEKMAQRKIQRREAVRETLAVIVWVAILLAMMAASFYFGRANG